MHRHLQVMGLFFNEDCIAFFLHYLHLKRLIFVDNIAKYGVGGAIRLYRESTIDVKESLFARTSVRCIVNVGLPHMSFTYQLQLLGICR